MPLTNDILFPEGLVGGLLIGLAATVLLLGIGRIAGISGIFGRSLSLPTSDGLWRWSFLAGLLGGAALYQAINGALLIRMQADGTVLIAAAALVGIGTRLGSGCTSGHGVCGIGRRSGRSLIATMTFMAVAIITVWITPLVAT